MRINYYSLLSHISNEYFIFNFSNKFTLNGELQDIYSFINKITN